MTDQKPREFVLIDNWNFREKHNSFQCIEIVPDETEIHETDIHVITYGAYTAKCREVESLKSIIDNAIEELKFLGRHDSVELYKRMLSKHQQGEGNPKGGSGE